MTAKVILDTSYPNGDHQQRFDIGVDGLINSESVIEWLDRKPTPVQAVYAEWENCKRFGIVRECDFDLRHHDGLSTCLVDVSDADPAKYRYIAGHLQYANELGGKVVGEHPIENVRVDLMYEYRMCKLTNSALGYRIRHSFGGFKRDYLRLLLPLCDRNQNVTTLACISRHLAVPDGSLRAIRTG
jgi:hypothetical protein